MLRCEFRLPSGAILVRTWGMDESPPELKNPPAWLENPGRTWERPQDPVLLFGQVKPGHEDDARRLLGLKA